MRKNLFIVSVLLVISSLKVTAQNGSSNLDFIENKGQWDKRVIFKGELNNGAFFLQRQGFTVLLHNANDLRRLSETHRGQMHAVNDTRSKNQVADNSKNSLKNDNEILHSHVYKVLFKGANDHLDIIPDKPLPGYNNYFIGNDHSKWAADCKTYQGITYKNIYPNIDIRYYSNNGQLKYDIIVHPGGNIDQVELKYEGIDKINIHNNQVRIKTSVGDVQELSPYSYQPNSTGRTEIECKYVLTNDNTIKFKVKNYSPDIPLIIDPTLVFCSFTGSKASNWGFTATPGPDGSFYAGGIVFGTGFPVSIGAFQTNFKGAVFDVGIMKFSSNGSARIYATYLGGTDNETPHSLICDPQGNLVVLGRTYSNNSLNPADNFPTLTKVGPGGGADIFVTKLNASGNGLIGSMVIGGKQNDGVNIEDQFRSRNEKANSLIRNYGDDSRSEVILDGANNIYVAASTQSGAVSDSFPITPGVFQPAFGGGTQDGLVMKINPNCSNLIFASFLGGLKEDAAFVLKLNPSTSDIYVAGATASDNFPGNKSGVIQGTYQGGICDGFVTIISNDGSTQIKTTYLGTSNTDAIYGIDFDKKAFPYIMGTTTGNWPVINAPFVNAGARQFIAKLQADLSAYVYSTTFGAAASLPNISPVAFLVDRCENVYVSGWGGWIFEQPDPYGWSGTFNMPVTPDAIQSTTDGRDFYFIVIKKNASALLYASFFGQTDGSASISEHVDGGTSRYDQSGTIYQAICANCNGENLSRFPTTPGVWAYTNGATDGNVVNGCNLAAVKIAFNFAGVAAGLKSTINGRYDSSGCVPLDVTLFDTIRNAKSYIWKFGDGTPDLATTSFQVNHTYNSVGAFLVQLIAIDSNSCNVSDTVHITILARNDKAPLAFDAFKLLPCESLAFQFVNLSSAPAGKPFTNNSFIWDFGDGTDPVPSGPSAITHSFASAGTYIVKLILADTNYCNYPDTVSKTLRIASLVKAQFETPAAGCAPYTAVFNNTSVAGQQFDWDFGDGSSSTDFNPTHLYANTGSFTITLKVTDPNTCNITDSYQFTITVNTKPQAAFTDEPIPPQANKPTTFNNNSVGAIHFKWFFGDGDSAIKATMDTVMHQYRKTGTFQACLVAYNQFECTDTFCLPVETLVNPLLDVPNAFTPGRFGQNGIVKVQGFGIATMTFRIYNRWGQKVFETNNPNQGWDGTYKGILQPMDAYAYTLEAIFFDGTKTTKKGDITLIR